MAFGNSYGGAVTMVPDYTGSATLAADPFGMKLHAFWWGLRQGDLVWHPIKYYRMVDLAIGEDVVLKDASGVWTYGCYWAGEWVRLVKKWRLPLPDYLPTEFAIIAEADARILMRDF